MEVGIYHHPVQSSNSGMRRWCAEARYVVSKRSLIRISTRRGIGWKITCGRRRLGMWGMCFGRLGLGLGLGLGLRGRLEMEMEMGEVSYSV